MNSLRAEEYKSNYAEAPHLIFLVDDIPLDTFLADRYNDPTLVGLVPTLLDWLTDPAERALTWQRIAPPANSIAIAPVLMCPDDSDFACTLVLVEVETTAEAIHWHRLGYAAASADPALMPAAVFDTIRWFEGALALTFSPADYRTCLEQFRSALNDAA